MRPLRMLLLGCVLAGFLLTACQQPQYLSGKYQAVDPYGRISPVMLTLQADGKGSWKAHQEEAAFQWESKEGKIWIHSKSGGVLVGKISGDHSIDITLPGVGDFHFVKVE